MLAYVRQARAVAQYFFLDRANTDGRLGAGSVLVTIVLRRAGTTLTDSYRQKASIIEGLI